MLWTNLFHPGSLPVYLFGINYEAMLPVRCCSAVATSLIISLINILLFTFLLASGLHICLPVCHSSAFSCAIFSYFTQLCYTCTFGIPTRLLKPLGPFFAVGTKVSLRYSKHIRTFYILIKIGYLCIHLHDCTVIQYVSVVSSCSSFLCPHHKTV